MLEITSALTGGISEHYMLITIQKCPYLIDHIEKTPERCLVAVKQDGLTLKYIPKSLQTPILCVEAVKQNGLSIRYVSKKLLSDSICLEAVKNNGNALSYIPDDLQKKEFYIVAVKQNGTALQYIPDKQKTKRLCIQSIKQNGLALEYIPSAILSKDFYLMALEQNGLALKYVPSCNKSKKICKVAVNNNPLALEYVPNRFLSLDLCNAAVQLDWKAYLYVPESMYTLENCLSILERVSSCFNNQSKIPYTDDSCIVEIVKRIPDNINLNPRIIDLERQLRARYFKEKRYYSDIEKFVVKEFICYQDEDEIKEFDTFFEFYTHLDKNLKGADLHDFDFTGINLKDLNIDGAYISSDVLIEQNLYDDTFYGANIKDNYHNTELMLSSENEVVEAIAILHDSDIGTSHTLNDNTCKMYYISDIHLNHKLLKDFPSHATELEVRLYIREYIKKILATAEDKSFDDYLLVAGDISFNYEISVLFYTELAKVWRICNNIIVVLGNHELWDFNQTGSSSNHASNFEEIIQRYRNLFSDLGIRFLQNDLLLSDGTILSEKELLTITPDVLKKYCLKTTFAILGGLGFSGMNPEFNATQGIYRNTIQTLDEDIKQTERFASIYDKLNATIDSNRVIILTHTPKENWSDDVYDSNWIYVNGHTHQNNYCLSDEKTVYADNQIGYYTSSAGLKHFSIGKQYDVFRYYADGIYAVSREQYLDFNRGIGANVTFNRTGKIHMLKRCGVYCFFLENIDTGKLYLLNGGMPTKLEHEDINFYFDRMAYYSDAIKSLFSGYHQALKAISDTVKKIGGTGTIHGCIVDIDFYNHIYLNPIDGTIAPYFALSIVDKYFFSDIQTLLLQQRSDLHDNYIKLLDGKNENMMMLESGIIKNNAELSQFVSETYMYKPSRVMRSLQYLTEVNVIRIWNDLILDGFMNIEG